MDRISKRHERLVKEAMYRRWAYEYENDCKNKIGGKIIAMRWGDMIYFTDGTRMRKNLI